VRQIEALVRDHRSAGLSAAEVALLDFAEKVVLRADRIAESDVELLRGHGVSDEEIFDVAAAAAARCFYSKVLDAAGTEPDERFRDLQSVLADAIKTSSR